MDDSSCHLDEVSEEEERRTCQRRRGDDLDEETKTTHTRECSCFLLIIDKASDRVNDRTKENTSMSVGVMRDEELNLRYPHVSHTLGDSREYNT